MSNLMLICLETLIPKCYIANGTEPVYIKGINITNLK